MTVAPHVLRRYIVERASGRTPRHEWVFYSADLGAWIRTDKTSARRHKHHQRIRVEGRPWCDVLGHRTDVADDLPLQLYFMTIDPEDWRGLEIAVRAHPKRCLLNWRASGKRIMAAVSDVASDIATSDVPSPLDGWPSERGSGQRSLLPR